RRPRYSARPFALTILAISAIALLSWAKTAHGQSAHAAAPDSVLLKRDAEAQDVECRLVHKARDQCAFVLANCPDEEAGIFSYLSLYYCRLPHAKPVAFAILVIWLGLLFSTIGIAASDFFCVNLSTISNLLGMSESLAGVTFLAFGNGSPDVFSTFAAFNTNSASLAMGELIGAAGFITAVVAGSMALVRPFKVARRSFVRDICFFIVAASFSMAFIWDGKLSLWESASMVAFYLFYVCFVMVWHWWLGRRKARRLRAAEMRSHYVMPGGEEEEIPQIYHDEDDGSASPMRGPSADDFAALEAAGGGSDSIEADDNEEMRERWLGELNDNMRVSRPKLGSRRNTHTPIRPSLVGALEFRAVLASLQKSRSIQSMPINLRRYSDDPTYTTQQQHAISGMADPEPRSPYEVDPGDDGITPLVSRPNAGRQRQLRSRLRAVSTNDMENTQLDPGILQHGAVPTIDFGLATPEESRRSGSTSEQPPPSPTISLSPPPSPHTTSRPSSPAPAAAVHPSPNMLAPPGLDAHGVSARQGTATPSPLSSPNIAPEVRVASRPQPRLVVPGASSPPVPFPSYTDHPTSAHSSRVPSLHLPSPSASPESYFHAHFLPCNDRPKVPRWWPNKFLPPPDVLLSTLFPTLANWKEKYIWEKMLGVVAAPSVFLLTVTLPVVEATPKEDGDDEEPVSPTFTLPGPLTPVGGISIVEPESSSLSVTPKPRATTSNKAGHHARASSNGTMSAGQTPLLRITEETGLLQTPDQLPGSSLPSEQKSWNRWLVIIQSFTAPFFIVLIVWANTEVERPRALLRPTLYSLLFSMCMLAILLATTTPNRPPRWRAMLCFLGFVVSISWISSIANEVVGVLKTLGVIMDMSDAILGLTIFAVGNSLGDFVADITVARLGFPVMALSACFGGPMLNILLGIGISGCYMTIKGGQHRHDKHPDRPMHFKPYPIDVSTTLVISGATLLVTLVGLLLAVPMRKWRMDRMIGWGLVALWSASTVANVAVEVSGLGSSL
ncbi:sodium/calcium exchanger protein-like protein, partial [Massarina eburnea CBS 473.64]